MTTQTPQERIFIGLLNKANIQFTPHFFGDFGKSPENVIAEKQSMISQLSDRASILKKKFLENLEKIRPKGQIDNLQTQKEINEQYEKFNKDIEARNILLKADTKTKKELEKLQEQLKQTEIKQALLEDQVKLAKESSVKVTSNQGAIVDTSDPGVILHTDKDIAKMKILLPDSTKK
jgi:glucose-6-phosphate-specific signal transduction histidine kinase